MTARDPDFRCASASSHRVEPLLGTASTVRAFLLIEHRGSWGVNALHDARLPDGLGASLSTAAAQARVRPLLIRRPGRTEELEGTRLFAAFTDPSNPWIETTILDDPHELLDLDLAALGAGRSPGLVPFEGSLFCVCTHGRHDACCAERGRPVATALAETHAEQTWEVSHIGGDRFAANLLVLPGGFYYGRLDAGSVLAVAESHDTGNLYLENLRGRSSYAMPVQFAELALRRHLGEARLDAVHLASREVSGGSTRATFEMSGVRWVVQVRTERGNDHHQLTCRAMRDNQAQQHQLVSITAVD